MMNVKNELPPLKEKIVEEEEEEDPDRFIVPPKRMVDIIPEPGMEDPDFVDTGLQLEAHNINDEGAVF